VTAIGLLASGGDIVVLRPPQTVAAVKSVLDKMFA